MCDVNTAEHVLVFNTDDVIQKERAEVDVGANSSDLTVTLQQNTTQ